MAIRVPVALTAATAALVGCDSSSDDLPTEPPTSIVQVATRGFRSPLDAVASPDGRTFYFTAYDELNEPAIFEVASEPTGSANNVAATVAVGEPLGMPSGLVMSCDGKTLFIADMGADMGADTGALFTLATTGGELVPLEATGLVRPSGLAMSDDCKTLYASGRTDAGEPAVFSLSIAGRGTGGAATTIYAGAPLVSPTGLHVDKDGVVWLMDHRAVGMAGTGVLFAIPSDGSSAGEVISDLRMGTTGGVSLTAGGGTAVMPTKDADGNSQLTSVHIASGEMVQLAAPDMIDPSGLRTARNAGVFAVVDSEGGALYRAE